MGSNPNEFLTSVSKTMRSTESEKSRRETSSIIRRFEDSLFERLSEDSPLSEKRISTTARRNLGDILKIGEDRVALDELVNIFDTDIVSKGYEMWHGRQFGMVPNTGHFMYSTAQYISDISRKIAIYSFCERSTCDIERSVLEWVTEVVGYPEGSRGVFVSGSSMGIVLALCAARDDRLGAREDYHRAVIYMTDQPHFANQRAINVVGLKCCISRTVPTDKYHRMDSGRLEDMVAEDIKSGLTPFLVIATMGTINLGCVDPLDDIGCVARKYGIWYHVDAAIGGFFLLSETIKVKYGGINLSDSITLDAHKGLSAPFGSGIVMVRNGPLLKRSMAREDVLYLPQGESEVSYEPVNYSFEVTRPFRSFPIWFALKRYGTDFMKNHIQEKLLLVDYVYRNLMRIKDVEVFMVPDLNIVTFTYSPLGPAAKEMGVNDATRRLLELISADQKVFLTSTTVGGVFYIRVCITSLRTHIEEVELLISVIEEKLDVLTKS